MPPSRREIQPSGTIPRTGKVFDAASLCTVNVRSEAVTPGLGRPRGLFLTTSRQDKAVEVRLFLGEGTGGAEAGRTFHVDGRGVWLSVVGWDYAKLEILNIPDDVILSYAWLTEPPPSLTVVPRWFQTVAIGNGSTSVPFGAFAVTPDQNVVGATWSTFDGANTYVVPAVLTAGVRGETSGTVLVYAAPLAAPLTLCWSLALV